MGEARESRSETSADELLEATIDPRDRPPGPPECPLVPGHLGTPDEVENRVHDLGITPTQLKNWARRHIEQEGTRMGDERAVTDEGRTGVPR